MRIAQVRTAVAVALLLASIFLVTYTGRVLSGDELQYFDAAGTVARFGSPLTDEGMWNNMPDDVRDREIPLEPTIGEPFLIQTAAVIYWAAERIPGLGLVHAVWLYNALVCALIGAAVYLLVIKIGAKDSTAVLCGVSTGLLTIVWTYSQTFFREPPLALLLLVIVTCLFEMRTGGRRKQWALGAAGIVAFGLALSTKDAAIFALPGLFLLGLPRTVWAKPVFRRWVVISGFAIAAALLLAIYTPVLDWIAQVLPGGVLVTPTFLFLPQTIRTALHTYLLSPGGSIWGTSPILVLALPGAVVLWRRHPAFTATVLAVTIGFIAGYALFRGEGVSGGNWYGGNVWPQRFLVPVVPLLVVLIAPVIDSARSRLARGLIALVFTYSLWWQLSSVVFNWAAYDRAVFDASFGLTYWLPGFNDLAYIRPVGLLRSIGVEPVNWAWARAGILPFAALFVIPAALALLALRVRRKWLYVAVSGITLAGLAFGGLRLLYDRDPFYFAERADLFGVVEAIRTDVPQGGAVLINSPETTPFWMNYGKVGRRWIVGLPYHPGDRGSFEQEVEVISDDAREEIGAGLQPVIRRWSALLPELWLFMDSSPALAWSRRPFERYMGERYYRVDEREFSAYARLIRYDTHRAPNWDASAVPQVSAPYTFTHPDGSGSLDLLGYSIPDGVTPEAGSTLPVSLVWRADQPPTDDYTVAVFVVSAANSYIRAQGADSWLGATFKTTTLLTPGEAVWDHRAVALPDDWPAGPVRLWVKVYDFDPDTGTITDLTAEGAEVVDGVVAVLPGEIH